MTKVSEDKSDDVLDDINEIIKDKLNEGEVKKEIKEEELEISKQNPKLVENVKVKEEEKVESVGESSCSRHFFLHLPQQ